MKIKALSTRYLCTHGLKLKHYRAGEVYHVSTFTGEYMLCHGFAEEIV